MSSSQRFRDILDGDSAEQPQRGRSGRSQNMATGGTAMERKIEYFFWGLTVIFLGLAFIWDSTDPNDNKPLLLFFPLVSGSLLMATAVIQKIGFNWNVSLVTWLLGIILMAFGIASLVSSINQENWRFVYFLGGAILMGGVALFIQIFRRS